MAGTPRTAIVEGEHGSDVRFYNYRGKEVFRVGTKDGLTPKDADSIKNYLETVPGEAGEAPKLFARGVDADIGIELVPKGAGVITGAGVVADPLVTDRIVENTPGANVTIDAVSDLHVDSSTPATTSTGALRVDGGVSVGGQTYLGNSIVQLGGHFLTNTFFDASVGTTASNYRRFLIDYYGTDVRIRARNWNNIYGYRLYLGNDPSELGGSGAGTKVHSLQDFEVETTTASTSGTTGAIVSQGGIGAVGAIYSNQGLHAENGDFSFEQVAGDHEILSNNRTIRMNVDGPPPRYFTVAVDGDDRFEVHDDHISVQNVTDGLHVDTIKEKTNNTGVTVDGTLIKDGRVAYLDTGKAQTSVNVTYNANCSGPATTVCDYLVLGQMAFGWVNVTFTTTAASVLTRLEIDMPPAAQYVNGLSNRNMGAGRAGFSGFVGYTDAYVIGNSPGNSVDIEFVADAGVSSTSTTVAVQFTVPLS